MEGRGRERRGGGGEGECAGRMSFPERSFRERKRKSAMFVLLDTMGIHMKCGLRFFLCGIRFTC